MLLKISQISQEMLESLLHKVAGLKETPTQLFSCKICKIFKNTFFTEHSGGCFLTNPDLCGTLCGEGFFWSFSTSLPWLSNIMLNLLSKSSFDISLLFKLNHAVTLFLSYIVDCEQAMFVCDSLCLH